jgi:hypothetical protein
MNIQLAETQADELTQLTLEESYTLYKDEIEHFQAKFTENNVVDFFSEGIAITAWVDGLPRFFAKVEPLASLSEDTVNGTCYIHLLASPSATDDELSEAGKMIGLALDNAFKRTYALLVDGQPTVKKWLKAVGFENPPFTYKHGGSSRKGKTLKSYDLFRIRDSKEVQNGLVQ